jgi:CspA family cold shock protein
MRDRGFGGGRGGGGGDRGGFGGRDRGGFGRDEGFGGGDRGGFGGGDRGGFGGRGRRDFGDGGPPGGEPGGFGGGFRPRRTFGDEGGGFGGGDRGGFGGGDRGGFGGQEGGFRPRPPRPAIERGPRQNGTVKFFNAEKGYGFITPDEGGADVFVHVSAVERSGLGVLDKGQKISFETEPDKRGKGPKAVNLQVEGGAPAGDGHDDQPAMDDE